MTSVNLLDFVKSLKFWNLFYSKSILMCLCLYCKCKRLSTLIVKYTLGGLDPESEWTVT